MTSPPGGLDLWMILGSFWIHIRHVVLIVGSNQEAAEFRGWFRLSPPNFTTSITTSLRHLRRHRNDCCWTMKIYPALYHHITPQNFGQPHGIPMAKQPDGIAGAAGCSTCSFCHSCGRSTRPRARDCWIWSWSGAYLLQQCWQLGLWWGWIIVGLGLVTGSK